MKRLTFLAALVSTTALISVGQAHAQTHATAPAQSSASPQGAQLAAGAASVMTCCPPAPSLPGRRSVRS